VARKYKSPFKDLKDTVPPRRATEYFRPQRHAGLQAHNLAAEGRADRLAAMKAR
jgi:hypothetical protein